MSVQKGLIGDVISVLRSIAQRASCFGGKMSQAATNLPEYTVTRFGREARKPAGAVDGMSGTSDEGRIRDAGSRVAVPGSPGALR